MEKIMRSSHRSACQWRNIFCYAISTDLLPDQTNNLSDGFPSESYFKRTAIQNVSWKQTNALFPEGISYQKYPVNICNLLSKYIAHHIESKTNEHLQGWIKSYYNFDWNWRNPFPLSTLWNRAVNQFCLPIIWNQSNNL